MESNLQGLRTQNLDRNVQDSDCQQQRKRNQKSRPLGRYYLKSRINMTPQEKAQELVDKMTDEIPPNNSKDMMTFIEVDLQASKQCALIAVDEIIKSNPCEESCDMGGNFMFINNVFYWEQVKEEIHKF